MEWAEPRYDLQLSRDNWRATFADILDLKPELIDDWTLDHLMREMITTRRLLLEKRAIEVGN